MSQFHGILPVVIFAHVIFQFNLFSCLILVSMIILILVFISIQKTSTAGASVKYNLSAYVASFVPNNLYTLTAVAFYRNYNGEHFYI